MTNNINYIVGGSVGAILGFVFDGMDKAFAWLCIFMLIDYITGVIQACKRHKWSSSNGFKGLVKKFIIMCVCVMSHGLAQMMQLPMIETTVICAFALNEFGSILENIENMGFGSIIPSTLRKILAVAKEKEAENVDKLK